MTASNLPASFANPATIGILGGMGPAAGIDLARLFLQSCENCLREHRQAVRDQAFPEHWLAQVPVVDRTLALNTPTAPQPLDEMARALNQLASLGARAAGVACNTAHAWHAQLQARVPGLELLHIAQETVAELSRQGHRRAALLATRGTYGIGLYAQACKVGNIECIEPNEAEKDLLMEGIYQGVKAGNHALAQQRFAQVGAALRERYGDIPLVMACTEIPLALPFVPEAKGWTLIDPSAILGQALARKAYGLS